MIDVRAWLASASWACLCGIAASLFLTVSLVGLFVLFFGALISAMLAPLLLLLPADVQWTGWQWFAIGLAAWLARRCRDRQRREAMHQCGQHHEVTVDREKYQNRK